MEINYWVLLWATLVPLVIGFVWYHPKIFGTAWMRETGMTEEKAKDANMVRIFGLTIVFAFLIAFSLQSIVIHQFNVFGILSQQPDFSEQGSESSTLLSRFMQSYGHSFRTFKHGAFHGALTAIFFIIPIMGTNALFERKSFRYMAINGGYWIVSLALMGGIICAWS